ncbi:Enamine deaminase [Halomicronema hongdechloris C2206]|uniref:Enamine deaminase n=2 Tax=Halomicronema hongdechloris TaxID=1209493 RepID=A0A1Z3HV25_9CYAN|nr:Enamine deaminase [Halomicronema hongdechloris C2206]
MNTLEIQAGLAVTPGYQYAQPVGNQLFVAGQVPHGIEGNLVGIGSPHAQASQCLKNLRTLMNLYGFSDRDIRQLKIYVVGDHANLTNAWQAVAEWFDNAVPPATLLGVFLLGHENQLVEIDATIVRIES